MGGRRGNDRVEVGGQGVVEAGGARVGNGSASSDRVELSQCGWLADTVRLMMTDADRGGTRFIEDGWWSTVCAVARVADPTAARAPALRSKLNLPRRPLPGARAHVRPVLAAATDTRHHLSWIYRKCPLE